MFTSYVLVVANVLNTRCVQVVKSRLESLYNLCKLHGKQITMLILCPTFPLSINRFPLLNDSPLTSTLYSNLYGLVYG